MKVEHFFISQHSSCQRLSVSRAPRFASGV